MSLVIDHGEERIVDAPFCGTSQTTEPGPSVEAPTGSNAATGYVLVPIGLLRPHDDNSLLWEEEPIDDLLVAIKKSGYLSPLIVMMNYNKEGDFDGTYTILGGHRRFRAACTLGYSSVMCKAIHPGDSELSALGVLWADNATCRTMTAADKLRAGIILFQRVPEGENKAHVMASTCGMSYDTAEKIMNAAAKVMRAMEENPEQADNIQKGALELAKAHGISKVSNEFSGQKYDNNHKGRGAPPIEGPRQETRWHSEHEYREAFESTNAGRDISMGVTYVDGAQIKNAIDEIARDNSEFVDWTDKNGELLIEPERQDLPLALPLPDQPGESLILECFKNLIKSLPVDHQDALSTLAAPVNLRELWKAIGYDPPDAVKDWKLPDLQTVDGLSPDAILRKMGVKEDVVNQLLIGG